MTSKGETNYPVASGPSAPTEDQNTNDLGTEPISNEDPSSIQDGNTTPPILGPPITLGNVIAADGSDLDVETTDGSSSNPDHTSALVIALSPNSIPTSPDSQPAFTSQAQDPSSLALVTTSRQLQPETSSQGQIPLSSTPISASQSSQPVTISPDQKATLTTTPSPSRIISSPESAPENPAAPDETIISSGNEKTLLPENEKASNGLRDDAEERGNELLNLPPPLPFDLRVENFSVGVPHSKSPFALFKKPKVVEEEGKKRWILNGVECECRSGEVLAILGGSGSGKTTLLNAIAGRSAGLPVDQGEVAFYSSHPSIPEPNHHASRLSVGSTVRGEEGVARRGRKLGKREVSKRIGFVRQQDYLVDCLTVKETLTYAARLRLPAALSDETIALIVEQTIDELGLRDAANTVVGGPLRKGISGGEKRRLSIGCVLVTLPSVLILDEPTSGLDAFTSYLLLLTLSHLARRGRTIILSIHAPRSDAFPLFDRIALLSKGQVVYSGMRRGCLPWFSELGLNLEKGVNPLDFLIDISSIDNRSADNEEESKARVHALINSWKNRDTTQWSDNLEKKSLSSPGTSHLDLEPVQTRADNNETELQRMISNSDGRDSKRPGFWRQTMVLTSRAHRNVYRNTPQLAGFALQAIALGVIIGLTFFQLPDNPTGIQSLKNLSFQLIPGVFYLQQVFWIYRFCTNLVIFDREREDNLYDVIPFIVSDWISLLIPSVLSPTIYVILVYFIAGLRMDNLAANLFTIIASTVLVQFATQGLALLAGSIVRNFAQASLIGNALNLFQIMSAGFILTNVPVYVSWIRWISPYFYSFRVVATIQFKDRIFNCPADSAANLNQCVGNNVLNGLNFDANINIGVWFAGLFGISFAQYSLACFILWIYPAGGVKHASEIDSQNRGKQTDVMESNMTRDRINVDIRHLSLKWERRGRGLIKHIEKTILNDLSASFPAGEVSAILGPSGAGKSTLLQLLAGRHLNAGPLAGFYQTGQILYAGQPSSSASKSNVAFVEQDDDWHLPSLTVRETLRYAAILRLPDKMPRKQKIARAETVLRMLGLKDCADLPVGGALLKGISGGEKRRLSLAVQMINDPAVLVVDEPTSGLDSSIALSVMQVLRDIAATGRTVIATIHQPRSDIWKLADNVTLLAKGGVVAFSGKRSEAIDYFTSVGHPMPSEFFNPADHLLDLVSVDPRESKMDDSYQRVSGLTSEWRRRVGLETGEEVFRDEKAKEMVRGEGTSSAIVALPVVIERHWKNLWRQKEIFFNRLVQAPLLGGLFILFFQRVTHGPSGAQDRIGITIESTSAIAFVGLLNAMSIFPADRNLYFHEARSSARYSPATFVFTYTLVELGFELLSSFAYAAIMNVGVGLQTSARIFFEFSMTIWALQNLGESMAMISGSWIATEGLTVTVVSTILSIAGQISGVISLSVPNWLAGIAWATCVKPASKIQIINEAVGLQFYCTQEELASGQCVAQNGEQLLALFGWQDLNVSKFVGIMIAIAIGWRLIAWLSISARVGGIR